MWPKDQDEFVANHIMPEGADTGDAWYFVFMRGDLVCKTVQGAPEPITADDFRWFDVEVKQAFPRSSRERAVFCIAC